MGRNYLNFFNLLCAVGHVKQLTEVIVWKEIEISPTQKGQPNRRQETGDRNRGLSWHRKKAFSMPQAIKIQIAQIKTKTVPHK